MLTAPLDIAAAAGAVLDALLGERELQKALFSADGYGHGPKAADDVGLGAVGVEEGTQAGYEGNDPDRRFLRAETVLTCESFGLPIAPGCLDRVLAGRAPSARGRAAGGEARPAATGAPAAARAGSRSRRRRARRSRRRGGAGGDRGPLGEALDQTRDNVDEVLDQVGGIVGGALGGHGGEGGGGNGDNGGGDGPTSALPTTSSTSSPGHERADEAPGTLRPRGARDDAPARGRASCCSASSSPRSALLLAWVAWASVNGVPFQDRYEVKVEVAGRRADPQGRRRGPGRGPAGRLRSPRSSPTTGTCW